MGGICYLKLQGGLLLRAPTKEALKYSELNIATKSDKHLQINFISSVNFIGLPYWSFVFRKLIGASAHAIRFHLLIGAFRPRLGWVPP